MEDTLEKTGEDMPALRGEVLLVEDSEMNQQLIAAYLNNMGANVTFAANGAEAIDIVRQKNFDLIYMDMLMPVMSGEDAVRTLRETGCEIPIVMLTANDKQEDRALCQKAGSDDYLTKPVSKQAIYRMTSRFLQSGE
jgi:CheY-like chemotaxis protein